MVNVNDFTGACDSDIIANAINAKDADGIIIIPPRSAEFSPKRDWWLLDRAILIPANTTIILENCKIKLSDNCRDNFFRTANCGLGISYPEKITNVHIKGIGLCILEGADHPRASGDGGKILACPCPYGKENILKCAPWIPDSEKSSHEVNWSDEHDYSYGTDALKDNESHFGDWRGIGVLFANADYFSIENLKIVESHGWGISLEACAFGSVKNIVFDACMSKEIDGMRHNMENQDGVDLRNGCHDITVSDITGKTGDDLVALTAIASDKFLPGGSLCTTHVMHNDWSKRERDIYNITIKNLRGTSQLCLILRLLACESSIYNIIIDGILDTTENPDNTFGTIGLGEADSTYGRCLPDSIRNIVINNVIANRHSVISISGYVSDSVFSNIINKNPASAIVNVYRKNGLKNVTVNNVSTPGQEVIKYH